MEKELHKLEAGFQIFEDDLACLPLAAGKQSDCLPSSWSVFAS